MRCKAIDGRHDETSTRFHHCPPVTRRVQVGDGYRILRLQGRCAIMLTAVSAFASMPTEVYPCYICGIVPKRVV
jgi:hypothetical protein